MKIKKHFAYVGVLFTTIFFLVACSGTSNNPPVEYIVVTASAPAPTNTPDPCASANLEAEVLKVHKYMREFDDASALATSRPRTELSDAIANLQSIRREAEDQPTPSCLADLRTYQVSHMNTVINTLIAFMGGSDQQTIDQGIAQARDLHDKYVTELARLLGQTMVPVSTVAVPSVSETPNP